MSEVNLNVAFWMEIEDFVKKSKAWPLLRDWLESQAKTCTANAALLPDPMSGRYSAVANHIFKLLDDISNATSKKNELIEQAEANAESEAATAHKPFVPANVVTRESITR